MRPIDNEILAYLITVEGSTAWAMRGRMNADREMISAALQRLKRKGLVKTDNVNRAFWVANKNDD